jgi:hypothetical protein
MRICKALSAGVFLLLVFVLVFVLASALCGQSEPRGCPELYYQPRPREPSVQELNARIGRYQVNGDWYVDTATGRVTPVREVYADQKAASAREL